MASRWQSPLTKADFGPMAGFRFGWDETADGEV
jgi:hypothetical protein